MTSTANANAKGPSYWLNSIIVVAIMFIAPRVIPPIELLTVQGMHALCIFVSLLWAWSFVDFIWPSLLSMIAVGLSGYMTVENAFISGFGNSTIIMLFFVFILTAYLSKVGLCTTLAYWVVSRKFCIGRPYVIFAALSYVTFVLGATAGTMASVLIGWAISFEIFKIAGFNKGDKFPMFLLISIMFAAVLGQCVFPFRPLAAITINSIASITNLQMPYGPFIAASTITCVIALLFYILVIRFIFRPDIKNLAKDEDIFGKYRDKIVYTKEQKIATVALVFVIVGALFPSFFPAEWWITKFFSCFTLTSLIALALSVLFIFSLGTGRGLDFSESIRQGVDWPTLIMLVGSMPAAEIMQSADSGVTTLINHVMITLLGDFSPLVIGIIFIAFAAIVTQVAHNVVMCIVLSPILANLSIALGFDPLPVAIFLSFGANIGIATPGASAWGAMIFGQRDWVPSKFAFGYSFTACIITLVVMCVLGLPIAYAMI